MGEGELRSEIEKYISEHNLTGKIMLTGFVNQSEVSAYYSIADVFVMCSEVGETWGLSVNEAMNFNLPIILSDLTGCSDDLVKENGYVFETGNIEALAYCMKKVSSDVNDRLIMGAKSSSIISMYSFRKIINNLR